MRGRQCGRRTWTVFRPPVCPLAHLRGVPSPDQCQGPGFREDPGRAAPYIGALRHQGGSQRVQPEPDEAGHP